MSFKDIDVSEWDCVEDYTNHRTFIAELSDHNFRCEVQIRDDFIWGQLYDVTEGVVVAENESIAQEEEWDLEAINEWVRSSLKEYFSS